MERRSVSCCSARWGQGCGRGVCNGCTGNCRDGCWMTPTHGWLSDYLSCFKKGQPPGLCPGSTRFLALGRGQVRMFTPLLGDAKAQRGRVCSGVWDMGALATQRGPLTKISTSPGQLLEKKSSPPHPRPTDSESVF